jgi:hypothetical protein
MTGSVPARGVAQRAAKLDEGRDPWVDPPPPHDVNATAQATRASERTALTSPDPESLCNVSTAIASSAPSSIQIALISLGAVRGRSSHSLTPGQQLQVETPCRVP